MTFYLLTLGQQASRLACSARIWIKNVRPSVFTNPIFMISARQTFLRIGSEHSHSQPDQNRDTKGSWAYFPSHNRKSLTISFWVVCPFFSSQMYASTGRITIHNGGAAMKKPYKVVITDHDYPDLDQERKVFGAIGVEFVAGQCKDEDAVIALARDADALLNEYAKLTPKVIEALENCKIIVRYGIGVDNVNIPAATKAGIMVCNVPTYGIHEVSDHVVGLFFSSIRKIPAMSETVKKGRWDCNLGRPIYRIHGKTLGIAGFGNIARMVVQKLAPWNIKVLGYDPFISESVFKSHGVEKTSFEQLLNESDFVSAHVPHTAETFHMFSYERFKQMKRGAIFINTARGPLVDEDGLYRGLQEGWVG